MRISSDLSLVDKHHVERLWAVIAVTGPTDAAAIREIENPRHRR